MPRHCRADSLGCVGTTGKTIEMVCLDCGERQLVGRYRIGSRSGARARCAGCGSIALRPATASAHDTILSAQAAKQDFNFKHMRGATRGPVSRAIGDEEFKRKLDDPRVPDDLREAMRAKHLLHKKAKGELDPGEKPKR